MIFEEKVMQQIRDLVHEELTKHLKNTKQADKKYVIKTYHPDDEEWETYIRPNRDKIFQFLEEGYQYAKLGSFSGCLDGKNLFKNANEVKIAFCDNVWIAISVYSGYRFGYKCVGIAATTAEGYRNLGKRAVKEIIQNDIRLYRRHYWTECSGIIEHYYETAHGIKLPSEFASEILNKDVEIVDDYHYRRTIKNGVVLEKVIYGFNSKSTFDKVYSTYKDYIDKRRFRIECDMLKESESGENDLLKQADVCYRTILIFDELVNDGQANEFPTESITMLKQSVDNLKTLITQNSKYFSKSYLNTYRAAVNMGETLLDIVEPMRIFTF